MKTFNKVSVMAVSAVALTLSLTGPSYAFAATAPDLGVANGFSVFGKAGITNSGAATHLWGNAGADLFTSIVGINASQVGGAIIAPTAASVQTAISNAFTALSTPPQEAATAKSLSGTVTVTPGVYTLSAAETLNGTVTLDGAGVYIFRSASSFDVANNGRVLLINGATACNVFWQIQSTMTIGTDAQMVGTIIADTAAITFGTGSTLEGRALSTIAAVTLLSNQITEPVCSTTASSTSEDIRVIKTASKTNLQSGPEKVTFTYRVSNTGDSALTDVSLDDNKCDDVDRFSGDNNDNDIMETNEAWNYRCTKTVKQTETNIATAKGHANGREVKATDKVTVTVSTPGLPNAGVEPETSLWNTLLQQLFTLFSSSK